MLRILSIICCLCLTLGCVSKIDFDQDRQQFIAITGVISNNPDERIIKFFENVPTFGPIKGRLYKNDGFEADLEFVDFRLLGIPEHIVIETGASYYIEIDADNGTTYRSKPQLVRGPHKPKELNEEVSWQQIELEDGSMAERYALDITATIPVQEQAPPIYLRFQLTESWSYQEVDDPRTDEDSVYTCYIVKGSDNHAPVLWKTNILANGESKPLITRKYIDATFLERHYFNVATYQISRDAYEYYETTERLLEARGLIIDEFPAPAIGNVFNVKTGEKVYGFVEFSKPDTSHIFVDGVMLGVPILDLCASNPCPPAAEDGSLPECPCADCLLIPGARYEKPPYFE